MLWFIIHGFQIDQTLLQINVFKVFQITKNEKQKKKEKTSVQLSQSEIRKKIFTVSKQHLNRIFPTFSNWWLAHILASNESSMRHSIASG